MRAMGRLWGVAASILAFAGTGAAEAGTLRPDQSAFLDIYRELVETNTVFPNGSCTRAAQQVATRLKAAGFADKELTSFAPPEHEREGGLVAIWEGSDKAKPAMLLLAHIDVVEAKREDWVRDPFKLIEEDGHYYGRGTADDKAQAAIFTDAMIRLRQSGFKPKRTIKLALTCGEESAIGAVNGVGWLARNRPELIQAGFALNEGGSGRPGPDGGPLYLSVQVSEKAPRSFTLETTNPGGHSSVPVRENAIYELSEALLKVRDLRFPMRLTPVTQGYFAKMGALRKDAMGDAMRRLAADPQDKAAEATVSSDRSFNAMLRTTCVATLLAGGHALNALPQRATAKVNCRVLPGETGEQVQAAITAAIADPGLAITRITQGERTLAIPPPLDPKIIGPMEKVMAKHFPGVPLVPMMSTGATDSTWLGLVKVPTYGLPGLWNDPETSGTHGLNERMPIDALYRGRDYMFDLIKVYATGG